MTTAAVLTQPNQPLELHNITWRALRHGQVYVRVLATGICGAQMQEICGEKGTHLPRLLGHEACIEVIDIGAGVTTLAVGDRAVAHWRKGAGLESESPRFTLNGQEHTAGQITTFSTHSVISENRLTRVPQDTPVELCALLGCGLSTALGTIENEANLRFGESVLIIGCGGLGLNLILAAKLRQAAFIAVVDVIGEKIAMAHAMGAKDFCKPEEMLSFYDHNSFDVVIDTTGAKSAIERALPYMTPGGRFIMIGQPKQREAITIENARHMFEGEGKTILATQGGRFEPHKDIPRYVSMYRAGLLNLDGLVSHRLPLLKINDGLELVRQGQAGRILIDCAE